MNLSHTLTYLWSMVLSIANLFTAEQWAAIFTGLGASAVAFAIPQVRSAARSLHLSGIQSFYEEVQKYPDERRFVYELPALRLEDFAAIDDPSRKKIEAVINHLNRIGLLLEQGLVSKRDVFGMCHAMIIRCWYQVGPYVEYRNVRGGARYGKRLERLDKRSKLYHDVQPRHRHTKILLDQGPGRNPILIYETRFDSEEWLRQKIGWWIRRILKWY